MKKSKLLPVVICAEEEWKQTKKYSTSDKFNIFESRIDKENNNIIYFYSGCGKTNAASCTQFIISGYNPKGIINLGTCAGIKGKTKIGKIYIIKSAIIYDYVQLFGNDKNRNKIHKDAKVENINIKWLKNFNLKKYDSIKIASGDTDANPDNKRLNIAIKNKAYCFDWESASIAKVCELNKTNLLILRGVSDYVEINYNNNEKHFVNNTKTIISEAIKSIREIARD